MKTIRYLDPQGRVILPSHIRKSLNLTTGSVLEVNLEDDGTIRITPTEERCVVCGSAVKEKYIRPHDRLICEDCAIAISFAVHTAWEKKL